jgi:hypothetical protein
MKHQNILLLAFLLLAVKPAVGQSSSSDKDDSARGHYERYEETGDRYLSNGDTSMAIHFYQKYIDHYPKDKEYHRVLANLRKLYIKSGQSFYLKEY